MKTLALIFCGFAAAWLVKGSGSLVFMYAPALIFPVLIKFDSYKLKLTYLIASVIIYSLMICFSAIFYGSFPVLMIIFFFGGAMMHIIYCMIINEKNYSHGLRSIIYFSAWYAIFLFACKSFINADFLESNISYFIVPAWFWMMRRALVPGKGIDYQSK